MAKFARHLNSFVAGELSPRVWGRTDSDQYAQGCQELLNKIIRPQGGATRRPGSIFITDGPQTTSQAAAAAFDSETRMIPFKFSRTDGAVVVLNTGSNGLNSVGIAIFNPVTKKWISPTISLSTDYVAFTGWTSQAELDAVQYAQSGDVMVLVSSKNPPVFLMREFGGTYVLKDIYSLRDVFPVGFSNRVTYAGGSTAIQEKLSGSAAPTNSQPYYNVPYKLADSSIWGTASASATTGTITITSSIKWGSLGMVGTIVRMTKSGVTGFVKILSTSNFTASALVLKTLGGTGTQDSWEYQDFGVHLGYATENWPSCVCFHDQRIWYANTNLKPNTLWASQVGDFTEMMIVRAADDANFSALSADRPFSFALAGNQVDDIQWMLSGKRSITIGTTGGEYRGESSGDTILGPLNPNFSAETSYGSKSLQAVNANGSIIFVDQTAQKLREFIYNRNEDAYRAVDLTYFADHMIRKGIDIYPSYSVPEIKELAVQQGSNNLIWVRDSNGMLHTFQKERDYGTLAWSTMQLGGAWDADGLPPKILSVCCVPNGSANDEDVYILVQRYLNGTTKIYFEKIGMEFLGPDLDESNINIERQPVFMDSAQMVHNLTGPKFFSRFASSINAEYFTTSATGTGTGSPTASNGLVLTGGGSKYVTYNVANALLVQSGTIVLEVTPNYSGTPAGDRHFFAISKSNADDDNLITLIHQAASDDLFVTIKDATGGDFKSMSLADWVPVAGTKYQFVISFDATAGWYAFWINGILVGSNTGAMTRDSSIAQFVVGTNYTKASNSDFTINKMAISTGAWGTEGVSRYKPAFALSTYVMGVDHLYGDHEVIADGEHEGDDYDFRTESLDVAIDNCALVGMSYTSRLKSMDLEAGSILGSAQGEMKRVHELTVRFERTVGARVGYDVDALDDINFQGYTYQTGTPIPLHTGDHTVKFPLGYDRNLTIIVEQEQPLPCTVTSMIARGLTYD